MKNKMCFGLKNKIGSCSVLSNEGHIELRTKVGHEYCGTMDCPFYKPHQLDLRLGNKIVRYEDRAIVE